MKKTAQYAVVFILSFAIGFGFFLAASDPVEAGPWPPHRCVNAGLECIEWVECFQDGCNVQPGEPPDWWVLIAGEHGDCAPDLQKSKVEQAQTSLSLPPIYVKCWCTRTYTNHSKQNTPRVWVLI
jgi:hypothetical protein